MVRSGKSPIYRSLGYHQMHEPVIRELINTGHEALHRALNYRSYQMGRHYQTSSRIPKSTRVPREATSHKLPQSAPPHAHSYKDLNIANQNKARLL